MLIRRARGGRNTQAASHWREAAPVAIAAECYCTITWPIIQGCGEPLYVQVPAVSKVMDLVSPGLTSRGSRAGELWRA
jgi:hypothetical protein